LRVKKNVEACAIMQRPIIVRRTQEKTLIITCDSPQHGDYVEKVLAIISDFKAEFTDRPLEAKS